MPLDPYGGELAHSVVHSKRALSSSVPSCSAMIFRTSLVTSLISCRVQRGIKVSGYWFQGTSSSENGQGRIQANLSCPNDHTAPLSHPGDLTSAHGCACTAGLLQPGKVGLGFVLRRKACMLCPGG